MLDNDGRIGGSGGVPARMAGRRAAAAQVGEPLPGGPAPRGSRIPTLRQLASLLVDGALRLPANYRRGTYLDLLV
jgi:hypothetical protein